MSFGSRAWNAIAPSPRSCGACHDREPEHEQRVREQRPEDRELRHDDLAGRQRNSTMNSSGRFPSVDCSTPVTAGPNRAPTDSVAMPIAHATPPSETPVTTNTATGEASMKCRTPPSTATQSTAIEITIVRFTAGARSPSSRTSATASARMRPAPCPHRAARAPAARPRRPGARYSAPAQARAAPQPHRRRPA